MTSKVIASVHNQRVKDAVKLRTARQRKLQGRFTIDGVREIRRALQADVSLDEIFLCDELIDSEDARVMLAQLSASAAAVWQVTAEVFAKLAFGDRQEGILAVARVPQRSLEQLVVPADGLVAVLEGVEKPGNVGAVLRSADAAGVSAVVVADPRTDLYNPNCIRASLGTVFSLPVCTTTSQAASQWLGSRNAQVFSARPDAAREYTDVDYRGGTAIVLGSEAAGLSSAWQSSAVTPIRLPMLGVADSLNVSAAAAVLFYEAQRQRR